MTLGIPTREHTHRLRENKNSIMPFVRRLKVSHRSIGAVNVSENVDFIKYNF